MAFNRFQAGSSVYKCIGCGRNTRDTGDGVDHLCHQCYEIAGLDNQVNDSGEPCPADVLATCNAHLAQLVRLGGDGQQVKDQNGYIWSKNNSEEPVVSKTKPADKKATKKSTTNPKPRSKKMTKVLTKTEKALNIVKKFDDGRAAGDLVARIMKTCKLNMPAARTYLYNARVAIENGETEVTVKAARRQRTVKVEGTVEATAA